MRILLSILPILIYILVLLIIDVPKLTKNWILIFSIFLGIIISVFSYLIGGLLYSTYESIPGFHPGYYSLTFVPLIEESLKVLPVIFIIRKNFLVSTKAAPLIGVTIGLGFSIVGNIFILKAIADLSTAELIIRGIVTAYKHGFITGIASLIIFLLNRNYKLKLFNASIISILIAATLHSISNYFFSDFYFSMVINLLIFPILTFSLINIKTKKIGE